MSNLQEIMKNLHASSLSDPTSIVEMALYVIHTWNDPGAANPGWHHSMKEDLRANWPRLARDLEDLSDACARNGLGPWNT